MQQGILPPRREGGALLVRRLLRASGLSGAVAGALIAVTEVVSLLVGRQNVDLPSLVNEVIRLAAFILLLLALVGLYVRQVDQAGTVGVAGFLLAFVGTTLLAGDLWFEAFVFPHLVEVAPDALATDPGGILLVGAFFSFLTFILGWLLFGVASFRAAVFPRVASVVLIGGTLILFPSPLFPPKLVVFAIAVGWMGLWLYHSRGRPVPDHAA